MEITEEKILEFIKDINKIISAEDCNATIAYLNGAIADLDLKRFELQTDADNQFFKLLQREKITNKTSEAEFKTTEVYMELKKTEMSIRKLRALRNNLKDKEDILKFKPKHYSGVIR